MFFTRTLGAVVLTSLVAGVAYAEPKSATETLNVTAVIPAAKPKLTFAESTAVKMIYDDSNDTLAAKTVAFTITGNSGLSIYLEKDPVLEHQTQPKNTIPLEVTVNVDGLSSKTNELGTKAKGAFIMRQSSAEFNVNDIVGGVLQIKPKQQTKIATTRVGTYKGAITVVVETNDTDAPVSDRF